MRSNNGPVTDGIQIQSHMGQLFVWFTDLCRLDVLMRMKAHLQDNGVIIRNATTKEPGWWQSVHSDTCAQKNWPCSAFPAVCNPQSNVHKQINEFVPVQGL